jgi:tectonin-like protein
VGVHIGVANRRRRTAVLAALTAVIVAASVVIGAGPASAWPTDPDGTPPSTCLELAWASITMSSSTILLGQSVHFDWDTHADCPAFIRISGQGFNQIANQPGSGSATVTPTAEGVTSWSLSILIDGQIQLKAMGSVTVQPLPARPATSVAALPDGRLLVVNAGMNGVMSYATQTTPGGVFGDGTSHANGMRSVAVETNADGRPELFAIDAAGRIWHSAPVHYQDAPDLWNWYPIPGTLVSIAAARDDDGRLELFGTNLLGQIWHRAQISPGRNAATDVWTDWTQFSGELDQVAAERNADGRVELFGINRLHEVYHLVQTARNANTWGPWAQIPGHLSSITVARGADNRLEIAGMNASAAQAYSRQQTPGSADLTDWRTVPNGVGPVAAEANADGRIEYFGVAPQSNLDIWHRAQTSRNSATWTDWRPLNVAALQTVTYPDVCTGFAKCVFADVNGDRRLDAVGFVKSSQLGAAEGDVWVALNDGFTEGGEYYLPHKWSESMCVRDDTCDLADVNGDGKADAVAFVTTGGESSTFVALSNGTGFGAPARWSTTTCTGLDTCRLVDMNNDWKADVVRFVRTGSAGTDGVVTVSLSNGSTGFGAPTTWSSAFCLQDQNCQLGDVDGNGTIDAVAMVMTGPARGEVWVASGFNGGFNPAQRWATDSKCIDDAICVVADVNDDQRDDVVARSRSDTADHRAWVSHAGTTSFAAPTREAVPTAGPVLPGSQLVQGRNYTCYELEFIYWKLGELAKFWYDVYEDTHDPEDADAGDRFQEAMGRIWTQMEIQRCV